MKKDFGRSASSASARLSALLALAERVEKAERGSRELDCRIFEALGGVDGEWAGSKIESFYRSPSGSYTLNTADGWGHADARRAADFTTSIDAALTLLPADYLWEVERKLNLGPSPSYVTPKGEPERTHNAGVFGGKPWAEFKAKAHGGPALAICAAALKALAAQSKVSAAGDVGSPSGAVGAVPATESMLPQGVVPAGNDRGR